MEKCGILLFLIVLLKAVESFKFNFTCEGLLNISCGAKPIVLISVMSVTRQNWACSLAGSGDRNNRKEAVVWRKCNGKTSCTIKSGMKLGDYKYLGIHYDCGKSYDMCSSVRIESSKAYLESPNYRNVFPYAGSTVCRCKAELAEPTRLVVGVQYKLFSSIDTHLMIKWRPDEVIQIYEETDLSPGVIYRETGNGTFAIMFNANGRNGTGFFQLFYKASHPITMMCNMDMPIIPTTQEITTSIQMPPNSTPIADVLTTAHLDETYVTTITTTSSTETTTVEPLVTSEHVQTTQDLPTTKTTSAKTEELDKTFQVTFSRKEVPMKSPIAPTILTTSDAEKYDRNWTEVPVVAKVINKDHSMKVLGVLIPALIGMSVLVAVTCFFTLMALLIYNRLKKRKKYYPRRTSRGNHVVSRSVYELEHPVPGKEESDQLGNGVVEDSAPPSVDLLNENLKLKDDKRGQGLLGCNNLPGKSPDSVLNRVTDVVSTESLVLHDNVLHQVMDEVDELAPGSPSLYATIERGRKMWIVPPELRDSDDGLVTLEKGPSLTFDKGHCKHHNDNNVKLNDHKVGKCSAKAQSEEMTLGEGQSLTLEDGKLLTVNDVQSYGDSERPTEASNESNEIKVDEDKFPVVMDSIRNLFSQIPDYAVVKKVKQEPANTAVGTTTSSSQEDTESENSELVFGNGHSNEPDYADIPDDMGSPSEGAAEASFEALVLPDEVGTGDSHGAYMSVDVTNLMATESTDHHIYEQV
ncbi:uncharacterized protein LOC135502321 [Lineus longissimus]|uniref:uncharacterized protein LOC135502321 n=1 Tax=Lineus longissimus TaxID=88925 RepID=UPI00315D26B8